VLLLTVNFTGHRLVRRTLFGVQSVFHLPFTHVTTSYLLLLPRYICTCTKQTSLQCMLQVKYISRLFSCNVHVVDFLNLVNFWHFCSN